ncbi:unnamed protein product [Cuscuta campestris]|uniref:SWIM-type domain-containing protein n=1 Tax=Cuscuta campestris TaxID=132261 RepID=A0A484MMM8_9ASTE|nr:unnamed protein product [Cuscuta campestris]
MELRDKKDKKKKNGVDTERGNGDTEVAFSDVEDEEMSCLYDNKCPEFKSDSEMEKFVLEPMLKFKNGNEYRMVIRDYSVRHGIQLELMKNEHNRVLVKCHTCDNWRVRASWVQGGPTFQIKTMNCPETHCAWRFDNTAATYKPIIAIDGCFIKTPFGGQLLCAVARDGNDNMFPIAFAIVPVENNLNWSWFLHHLHIVIGDPWRREYATLVIEKKVMKDDVTHVVKFSTKECTCRKYQLTGVPCLHALAVCHRFRYNEDLYVDKYFYVATYKKAYGNVIQPVPGSHNYVNTLYTPLLPCVVKRKIGRPKKNRRKSAQEEEDVKRSSDLNSSFTLSPNSTTSSPRSAMDSYDLRFESIILETQFEDIGVDDGDFISDKEEDEVIVIDSDDDMADVAPVRERKDVILLESQKDAVFLLGREEPNFVVLYGDIDDADWCEKSEIEPTHAINSRMHLHIDMLNILLPSPDPQFWASNGLRLMDDSCKCDLTVVLFLRGVSVIAFTSITSLFLPLFPAILFLTSMAMPSSNCFFAMAHMLLTVLVDTLNCAARKPSKKMMVQTRSNANAGTGAPHQGEKSATGGRHPPINTTEAEALIQRVGITVEQFKEVLAVLTPNREIVVEDATGVPIGEKAGPAGSQGKKKKVRRSQKKKATKPNEKARIEDALSRLDEEDESSSFERASAFDRLGDPKAKKPRTSAFDRLQDTRSARKGDLSEMLKERRGESTATSTIGSEERRKAVEDKEAAELWRMYERLERRLDAQNPYRQAVFNEEFINRREKEARDVQGADDQALIAMLQVELPQGDVCKELRRNPLSTYQEMLARAKYLALEEEDDKPPVRKEKKSGPPVAEGKKRKYYEDMPGVDPKIICHRLAVDPTHKPVKQKKRFLSSERREFVTKQVTTLQSIGHIREVSNNEAEYEALLCGLRLAASLKAERIQVQCDSKLIVGHVMGEFEAKDERMKRYRDTALELLKAFGAYWIEQVPREENAEEDILSKLGPDSPDHIRAITQEEELLEPSISPGQVENTNRTIVDGLKKKIMECKSAWVEEFPYILWTYRTTPRKATGETPFALTYGFEARAPAETSLLSYRVETFDAQENEGNLRAELHLIDERRERAYIWAENYRRQVKSYHDQRVRPRQFGIGDWVLRKREVSRSTDGGKFAKSFEGPYIIKEMLADGMFRLQTPAGGDVPRVWNAANLIKFYQ